VTDSAYSSLTGNFEKYRVVNFGVRVVNTSAALSTTGLLTLTTSSYDDTNYDPNSGMHVEDLIMPLTKAQAMWISRIQDRSVYDYSAITRGVNNERTRLYIGVMGAPATTPVITVEFRITYELIADPGDYTARAATKAAPFLPNVIAGASNAIMDSAVKGGTEALSNMVTWSVKNALYGVGSRLLSNAATGLPMLMM
jgi:hypothetical protein